MTDMLVRDSELGAYPAHSLRPSCFALMRGHGSATVGRSLKEAVHRSVYAEIDACIQTYAIGLGGQITYLSAEEAALATEATINSTTDLGIVGKSSSRERSPMKVAFRLAQGHPVNRDLI
jgi:ribulose-5-phosphate 4-epimerase/fuculose-1-phosphate aldolase